MFSGDVVPVSVQVGKTIRGPGFVSHIVPFEVDQVWLKVEVGNWSLNVFSSHRRFFKRVGALSLFPSQFDVSLLGGCLQVA